MYSQLECERFIEKIELSRPKLATNNPLYRDQDRVIIDEQVIADDLFDRIRYSLPKKIEEFSLYRLNEILRFYRYAEGQKFLPHMEDITGIKLVMMKFLYFLYFYI